MLCAGVNQLDEKLQCFMKLHLPITTQQAFSTPRPESHTDQHGGNPPEASPTPTLLSSSLYHLWRIIGGKRGQMSSGCVLKEKAGAERKRGRGRKKEEERERTIPRPHTPTASQDVTSGFMDRKSWVLSA